MQARPAGAAAAVAVAAAPAPGMARRCRCRPAPPGTCRHWAGACCCWDAWWAAKPCRAALQARWTPGLAYLAGTGLQANGKQALAHPSPDGADPHSMAGLMHRMQHLGGCPRGKVLSRQDRLPLQISHCKPRSKRSRLELAVHAHLQRPRSTTEGLPSLPVAISAEQGTAMVSAVPAQRAVAVTAPVAGSGKLPRALERRVPCGSGGASGQLAQQTRKKAGWRAACKQPA